MLTQQSDAIDYFYYVAIGILTMMFQTLRFKAMQYDDPGKLAQYTYLQMVYYIIFDLFIFHVRVSSLQWIGLSIIWVITIVKIYKELKGKK